MGTPRPPSSDLAEVTFWTLNPKIPDLEVSISYINDLKHDFQEKSRISYTTWLYCNEETHLIFDPTWTTSCP